MNCNREKAFELGQQSERTQKEEHKKHRKRNIKKNKENHVYVPGAKTSDETKLYK